MNICLTVNSSPWSDFKGGGQIAVHYLATYLAKNNCNVWVIYTGKGKEQTPSKLNYNAVFAKHFDVKTINLNIFSIAFQVFKLSRNVKLDIIHGNSEEAFFLPLIKKLSGSKFVLTSHSPYIPNTGIVKALRHPIQMLKRLNFYLLRTTAINSDCLVTYSSFSKKLVKNGTGNKYKNVINIISPGVDPSWFDVANKKKEWPGPQPQFGMENRIGRASLQSARRVEAEDGRKSNGLPHVTQNKQNTILQDCSTEKLSELLYFGRIEHEKGIDILIKAFAGLLKEYPFLKLHIIGEGNYLNFSKKLCRELKIENHVVFYGWKEINEIQEVMSNCDLCILPSRVESFGLTIAEAMAGGIPVISTKTAAITEIIQDGKTGILVPPEDIKALKKAIYVALKNKDQMQKNAAAAREKVKKEFSWDLAAKKHIEIYKSILK